MAATTQPRPEVGDMLIVIHDFQARSSDELTLAKGDRVELLESDDEFGDGWFLGKHMVSGNTGLFPEAPSAPHQAVEPHIIAPSSAVTPTLYSAILQPAQKPASPTTPTATSVPLDPQVPASKSSIASPASTSSFNSGQTAPAMASGYTSISTTGHDSHVLHETLNVIDEHITDLRAPSESNGSHLHATADSGSEYSSNRDHRLSYIQGEETDEEEDGLHSRAEIESWGPDDVAEYLFTVGVEKRHCEVFRDQEITGEVLLGMDQSSLFLKVFDLGPVGRRLKTWQKIKALQDEVNGQGQFVMADSRRSGQKFGNDISSDEARRLSRSRTNTITSSSYTPVLQQRLSQVDDHSNIIHSRRLSLNQTPKMEPNHPMSPVSPISPRGFLDGSAASPSSRRSIVHEKRPSAASVRDLHQSRRHSSTDYRLTGAPLTSGMTPQPMSIENYSSGELPPPPPPPPQQLQPQQQLHLPQQPNLNLPLHKKHPSFDRNWTLGNATASVQQPLAKEHLIINSRPLSSTGLRDVLAVSGIDIDPAFDPTFGAAELDEPALDFDRGYFSGTNADDRRKPFLQKKNRDSLLKTSRGFSSNVASYAEEQRVRSATALSRHSRFGSVDSIRNPTNLSSAVNKYYGITTNGGGGPHHRTTSTTTTDSSLARPALPPKDGQAPSVTKLDGSASKSSNTPDRSHPSPALPILSSPNRHGTHSDWFSKPGFKTSSFGLRALSDAVAGHERAKTTSPASHSDSISKDSPVQSPSRTGSSTPSAGPSFELDSPHPRSPSTTATMVSARSNVARKKGKKETSAYQRGLQRITPREAMVDADYSGWMKKKSSNLMAAWKPRLFVLKGRRLAYYYSEDDDQEKGLIDISFHRVLPADNERLTGLHATLTGASTTSAMPANSHVPTLAAAESDTETDLLSKPGVSADSIFIFKLIPPRAGLSRAVNFTKPTVHYFAVPNVKQGRLWMAALMKATIDRDDTVPITTTYQQKTISLLKARQMRHRPPALMNLDEELEDSKRFTKEDDQKFDENGDSLILGDDEKRMLAAALATTTARKPEKVANGLGITYTDDGSALPVAPTPASRLDKSEAMTSGYKVESARARQFIFEPEKEDERLPMSA
ncbi:polarized growth protein [Niveomyces insectorum RCEF 264]|uniref:Polarized growth protein n=1 Tax=Niveomyces insectorum RCEF 264 TaxID=1081102 RepID=A0A162K6N0_9HYPO|nr:polarized growth protein [Niveomyces insectorum RCEF 264]